MRLPTFYEQNLIPNWGMNGSAFFYCTMIHIGKLIEEELHRQERSVTWFANKLYCDRTNTYKIFKRQSIDTELLLRISQVLHVNFFEYYSRECQNREKQSTLM